MRLIYLTDIHDAFGPLETVLRETSADLYALAGDLLYRTFSRYETAWRFMELQERMRGYRSPQYPQESLRDVAERIVATRGPTLALPLARRYLRLARHAEKAMLRSYERLERVLARFPERRVLALPGNYDMDLGRTALRDRDFHRRCLDLEGWRIAGYGGSPVSTPGIPDHLQVPFGEEWHRGGGGRSEPLAFLREARPDVLLLHHPPYGHLDRIPGHGHVGSPGIRDYVEEAHPLLVLSGHVHEDWGGRWADGTCLFNPSNFGRVMEVTRVRPGGHFLEVVLTRGGIEQATLRRVSRGELRDIAVYRSEDRGVGLQVMDGKRFRAMGKKPPTFEPIRPIREFQKLKSFFLGHESPETKRLVGRLRAVSRRIRNAGMNVAFDLLGSLNLGMAGEGSDLDLVVYLQGEECRPDELDACAVPAPLAAVFEELRARRIPVEVCDSLDLDRVERAIRKEDDHDGHLQRFLFYRAVCRPVNLRLIKPVENRLLGKARFRQDMERKLREHVRILVSSRRHVRSFEKYVTRLREKGVPVPREVEESIREYLRG